MDRTVYHHQQESQVTNRLSYQLGKVLLLQLFNIAGTYAKQQKIPENVKQLLQLRVTRKKSLSSDHFSCNRKLRHHNGETLRSTI